MVSVHFSRLFQAPFHSRKYELTPFFPPTRWLSFVLSSGWFRRRLGGLGGLSQARPPGDGDGTRSARSPEMLDSCQAFGGSRVKLAGMQEKSIALLRFLQLPDLSITD